jgi:hypothetical protein
MRILFAILSLLVALGHATAATPSVSLGTLICCWLMSGPKGTAHADRPRSPRDLSRIHAAGIRRAKKIPCGTRVFLNIFRLGLLSPNGGGTLLQCSRILACKYLAFSFLRLWIHQILRLNCMDTAKAGHLAGQIPAGHRSWCASRTSAAAKTWQPPPNGQRTLPEALRGAFRARQGPKRRPARTSEPSWTIPEGGA